MTDPDGRFIFVNCSIEDKPITLASVYSPNKDQQRFLQETLLTLDAFKTGEVLLGGDLNLINDPNRDRSAPPKYIC